MPKLKPKSMGDERDWLFEHDEVLSNIRRYEDMMSNRAQCFFDVYEFEGIINHYINRQNFNKAIIAAEYAYRIYPGSTTILMKIAHLLISKGKANESIKILNKLEKIEASNYEIYVLKGNAYNIIGQSEKACLYFDKAISLTQDENREEVLCNVGYSFQQQGKYEIAIKYFASAYKLNNYNINLLYELAYCYDQTNNYQKSIYYYEKYLDEDPYSDNAWFNLGTVYTKIQANDKAIEAYDYATAINDQYSSAYYNKANILSNLERYDDALLDYLEFLKHEQDHVVAHCYIGECYEKMARFDEALFFFQKAIDIDKDCADGWFGKGIVKMHQEMFGESINCINKALELIPDNQEYIYAKGLVYMKIKDYDTAIDMFSQVIEKDPLDYEAWLNYADILHITGKTEEAIELLTDACNYHDANALINIRLASYLFLSDSKEQAYIYLEKALSLDPECAEELYLTYPDAQCNNYIMSIVEKHFNQNLV